MTKEREALKLALDWLVSGNFVYPTALRTAIEEAFGQPEQEPVVWKRPIIYTPPHFAPPPRREWVGLSHEDVKVMVNLYRLDPLNTAFQIEAKLKELNT